MRNLSRSTLYLYGLLAAVLAWLLGIRLVSGTSWGGVLGWPVPVILRFPHGVDSWGPLREATRFLDSGAPGGLYQEIFFSRHIKFQYPPASLLLVDHFSLTTLTWISLALFAVNVAAIALIVESGVRSGQERLADGSRFDTIARVIAVCALCVMFYPLTQGPAFGQIQCWLNGAFALAVWFWLLGLPLPGGVLLGLLTWVKPNYALFLVWAGIRRQHRLAAAGISVAALGIVAGIAHAGLREQFAYARVFQTLARLGEGVFANQSVNGLLQRLLNNIDPLHFDPARFPAYNPVVFYATTAAMVAAIGAALWLPARRRSAGTPVDLALFTVAITISAPIAWDHHYGVIPPVLAAAVVPITRPGAANRATVPLLMLAWLLMTAQIWPLIDVTASPWNVVESYRFAGGAVAGVVLALACRRPATKLAASEPLASPGG